MAYGISGIWAIVQSLLQGKLLDNLTLSEWPNMPFLYWLAVVGAVIKRKWTNEKRFPALEVTMATPTKPDPKRLAAFKKLAGVSDGAALSADYVPSLFLMTESFRLVMAVLTLPAFPVSILGTVVNKRARYTLLRRPAADEALTYSCKLNPAVRATFSGHAEFDLLLSASSAARGDVVWQAVLSLVLMNPKKGKKGGGGGGVKKDEPAGGELLDTWALAGDTGLRYAKLDGDISPMHLYKATALLMGFPAPVANVHYLAGRAEASLAAKKGPGGLLPPPLSLELEFKKPTLLPNRLAFEGVPAGQDWAKASASKAGYGLRLTDKKGAPIFVGAARTAPAGALTVDDLAAEAAAAAAAAQQ